MSDECRAQRDGEAGVGPFLQAGRRGRQNDDHARDLDPRQLDAELVREAEMGEDLCDLRQEELGVGRKSHLQGEEGAEDPIGNLGAFRSSHRDSFSPRKSNFASGAGVARPVAAGAAPRAPPRAGREAERAVETEKCTAPGARTLAHGRRPSSRAGRLKRPSRPFPEAAAVVQSKILC